MASTDTLTDKTIRAKLKAAAATSKPVKLSDGGGLRLDVQPGGAGWWRLRYRFAGKEQMLSLGVYPDVPLALARQRRDEARGLIAAGVDPSAARKADKAAQAAQAEADRLAAEGKPGPGTFEAVAREWLTTVHEVKVSAGHAERTRIRFEQDAFPWLGRRPVGELEAPELLTCLRRVTARGAIETAHRLKDACGQVFRYGIATGTCTRNPAADLRDALPPVPTRHLAAIVDPKRAAELLRAMGDYAGHPVTRDALALSALLFLRPGELRQMEWAWVDLEGAQVAIPGALMKRRKNDKANGGAHVVPLAPQAVAILKELRSLTGHGRYVFPSLLTGERCMSENTVRSALRRLGYSNDDMTAHGFRAMARTMAAERLGIDPQVIEAQLAHAVPDALGRAYNRTTFAEQRRELMVRWADYLDRLRDGAQVLPFKAA
ncbi:tyrosine-type recombinase/integrase [Aquabacterium sp.]|uniref:tyrosine-type recombinase/integrase n=1 Tax=Aquabacterium sp. TaxID=1872578 RepID=UPI002C24E7C7|nr:integrase arm-type DNA-binding domain-containing protein [Aquabacterium sp.]HSW08075.1 integrase arm-type DNA-binding domain-containing protein [Aquabacterium sp.]